MTSPIPLASGSRRSVPKRNSQFNLTIVAPQVVPHSTGPASNDPPPLTSVLTHDLQPQSPGSRHVGLQASPGPATSLAGHTPSRRRTAALPSLAVNQPDIIANPAPTKIDQNTEFWKVYNDVGDREDKEFVNTSGGDLDVLLIFAGLFSATNTSFIIESYKSLQADPAEETNKLLQSLISVTQNPRVVVNTEPFTVAIRDIRINACFFTSLCCSLTAAFGAVLAKQWLTQYDRDGGGSLKTPSARGQERQRKFEGRDKWHLEDVIVTLPTLLQFSLFFFFIGLVDLLWPLNKVVTGITLGFTLATFAFYITTIAISVYDDSAPFQTRLSPLLRSPILRIWTTLRLLLRYIWNLIPAILEGFSGPVQSPSPKAPSPVRSALGRTWGLVRLVIQNTWALMNMVLQRTQDLVRSLLHHVWGHIARSIVLHIWALTVTLPPSSTTTEENQNAYISCISYLLERVTTTDDLKKVAQAFISLSNDPGAAKITVPFIDFHLKPTRGEGEVWCIPSLSGPTGPSLLNILKTLIKEWKTSEPQLIRTPLYSLNKTTFFHDIPRELRAVFLANPADTDSCHSIVDILLSLHPNDPSSAPNQCDTEMEAWRCAWIEDDVTKNLESGDAKVLQNTLTVLNFATRGCIGRAEAWDTVKRAKSKNSVLRKTIHSVIAEEISVARSEEPDGLNCPHLLEWFAVSNDMDGLAVALEALPDGLGRVVAKPQPFVRTVVETLIVSHLKPGLGSWWILEGLHGQNRRSLLRILHVIVVRWRYLESDLEQGVGGLPPLNAPSLISSLRAELWKAFLAEREDGVVVHTITEICKNLPAPAFSADADDISTTAMRNVSAEMSTLFRDGKAKGSTLEHCFAFLCANADSLAVFANFYPIRLTRGESGAIPNYLRSQIKKPETLKEFWPSTFCAQFIPIFFPEELDSLRFARYLDHWFRSHAKHDADTPIDKQEDRASALHDRTRQKWLYWTYILSLQRLLTSVKVSEWSKEPKNHKHQLHLLEILDDTHCNSYSTCAPLALHVFFCIWSVDPSGVTAEGLKGITTVLTSTELTLSLISLDLRMYQESSRDESVSHEQWSIGVSDQVVQDMSQMVRWIHDYVGEAIKRGLVDLEALEDALAKYASWCQEMDKQLGAEEYSRLPGALREVRKIVRNSQIGTAGSA